VEWVIEDSSSEQVLQGSGESIEGVFAQLPPDEYTLTWIAENSEGGRVQISREFVIS
jgi:hypothetical protein